ncbi:MAG TPA: hotdog fold thioesterase [Chitinophagaceae bacterium]|nr:hotdog fold thioesterase [Chitinophagaceae bacterium]
MSIWYKTPELNEINNYIPNTLAGHLDMKFTEIGDNYLKMSMPVDSRTHQPYGLLHGGASAALAETVGSVASALCINPEKQSCVGIEINCNHIRAAKSGIVIATAESIHLGGSTHVWDIKIHDENNKLICVSRLTVAVINKVLKK